MRNWITDSLLTWAKLFTGLIVLVVAIGVLDYAVYIVKKGFSWLWSGKFWGT